MCVHTAAPVDLLSAQYACISTLTHICVYKQDGVRWTGIELIASVTAEGYEGVTASAGDR